MSQATRITATLPIDISEELIATGNALPIPSTRTGFPIAEIVVTGMGVLTAVVTLDQASAALDDLVRRLTLWRRRTHLDRDPVVSVDAQGPGGRITLKLTASTTDQDLAHIIALVLSKPDETKFSGVELSSENEERTES
jgi:hypothetical protein